MAVFSIFLGLHAYTHDMYNFKKQYNDIQASIESGSLQLFKDTILTINPLFVDKILMSYDAEGTPLALKAYKKDPAIYQEILDIIPHNQKTTVSQYVKPYNKEIA
jgi:hypothetical protein